MCMERLVSCSVNDLNLDVLNELAQARGLEAQPWLAVHEKLLVQFVKLVMKGPLRHFPTGGEPHLHPGTGGCRDRCFHRVDQVLGKSRS